MNDLKKWNLKMYVFIAIVNSLIVLVAYFVFPVVQGFSILAERDLDFQRMIEAATHPEQYTVMFVVATILHIIFIRFMTRRIRSFLAKTYSNKKIEKEEIARVRKDCINIPYKYYIVQIVSILVVGLLVVATSISNWVVLIKTIMMVFSIISLIALIQIIYLQGKFRKVILQTYNVDSSYEKNTGYRIKFSTNLIIQIIPFLAVSIIVISLLGYAKTTEEKGNSSADYYKTYMNTNIATNVVNKENLKKVLDEIPLKNETDFYFIIPPNRDGIYVSEEGRKVTDFFLAYMDRFFEEGNGRVYEFFGTEQQAYVQKIIDSSGNEWYFGFEYFTADENLMLYYFSMMIGALIIFALLVYLLSSNASRNIIKISKSLEGILQTANIDEEHILPILSNDEIGDLSFFYNKIQKKMKKNQDIIVKQSKFASMGQTAGQLVHSIKNPAAAIDRTIKAIMCGIEDEQTRQQAYNNIAESAKRILDITSNASKQVQNFGSTDKSYFHINEVISDVEKATKIELNSYNYKLIIDINDENNVELYGERIQLYQALMNLVTNSILCYAEKNVEKIGNIVIKISQDEQYYIISVEDWAGGIPESIQATLFKEQVTTRGMKGSGIGLFMSNVGIQKCFGGDITFETQLGEGTTFYIKLLKSNKEEENENELQKTENNNG